MKILIIGCSGILGSKLFFLFQKTYDDLFGTYNKSYVDNPQNFSLDITKKQNVEKIFLKIKPDIVIQTAAFTDVDGCENDKQRAFGVNVNGTKNIVESCQHHQAKMIYISTDYIFSGMQGCYSEDDDVNPVNYYGESKLLGEQEVSEKLTEYIIARTAVLYGANQKDFVNWVIYNLSNNQSIKIVTDQIISPTLNNDIAEQLLALISANVTGIFHTAGGECISRYDFALKIADFFQYDKKLIHPIQMSDLEWIAPRPKNSSLNITKISQYKKPYSVNQALTTLKKEMEDIS